MTAAFETLTVSLRRLAPVSERALQALSEIMVARSFPADAWLLRAGDQAESAFFIAQGLVREFYTDASGAEHTRRFVHDQELTGSLLDLLSKRPAVTYVQALEPTQTLAFSYRQYDALCARFDDLQLLARRVTEALYICKAEREHAMLALDARERLAQWHQQYGAIDARIRRRHLASYLGITPEHLSRLQRG